MSDCFLSLFIPGLQLSFGDPRHKKNLSLLGLIVGEEAITTEWEKKRGPSGYYGQDEGFVCTPTSTVVAMALSLLFLFGLSAVGFAFFYRTKRRYWAKMSNMDPYHMHPQSK
ncbi:uncharacterized protein LOC143026832 [Oratosquilla oratoria]|uniref:uncharacterized protein LOC143026832 n=1 Tax=Oratosquilla oratoria TaxID=337810 RepID=UPI003F759D2C